MKTEEHFANFNVHAAMSDKFDSLYPAVVVNDTDVGFVYHKWMEDRAQFLAIILAKTKEDITTRIQQISASNIDIDDVETGQYIFDELKVFKCHASKWREVKKQKSTWKYINKDLMNTVRRILK